MIVKQWWKLSERLIVIYKKAKKNNDKLLCEVCGLVIHDGNREALHYSASKNKRKYKLQMFTYLAKYVIRKEG